MVGGGSGFLKENCYILNQMIWRSVSTIINTKMKEEKNKTNWYAMYMYGICVECSEYYSIES